MPHKKDKKKSGSFSADDLILPLVPLKLAMKKILKDRGITPPDNLKELAHVFYDKVVKAHKSTFEPIDHIEPVMTLTAIVTAIIKFIKDLKKKKESGQKLDKSEQKILDTTEKLVSEGEETVKGFIKDEATFELGKIAPLLILAFVAILLLKK